VSPINPVLAELAFHGKRQIRINQILAIARDVHAANWKPASDESAGDKLASKITKEWQRRACELPNGIQKEVEVSEDLNEKIDLLDTQDHIAYEMKVSGKNPQHEFYKDIFKIMVYNKGCRDNQQKIQTFVFVTEKNGAKKLHQGMAAAVAATGQTLGFCIRVEGIS